MRTVYEQCDTCKGSGTLDYYEENRRGNWTRRVADGTNTVILDGILLAFPNALRIQTGKCEVCHGEGSIMVEHFTCKIF